MPAAGRHADVGVDAVVGDRLEQVEGVQPHDQLHVLVGVVDLGVAPGPEHRPGAAVGLEKAVEVRRPVNAFLGAETRLGDAEIPAGVERNHLLDGDRHAFDAVECERLARSTGIDRYGRIGIEPAPVAKHPCPRRQPDAYLRLVGLDHQADHLVAAGRAVERHGFQRLEVSVGELAVAFDPPVDHRAVQRGLDLDAVGPIEGGDRRLDRRHVRVGHADDAPGHQSGLTAIAVAQRGVDRQDAVLDVQFLAERQHRRIRHIDDGAVRAADRQRQPVRRVEQILVLDHAPGHLRLQPVVAAGQVGSGIVDVFLVGLDRQEGAACAEVAVA